MSLTDPTGFISSLTKLNVFTVFISPHNFNWGDAAGTAIALLAIPFAPEAIGAAILYGVAVGALSNLAQQEIDISKIANENGSYAHGCDGPGSHPGIVSMKPTGGILLHGEPLELFVSGGCERRGHFLFPSACRRIKPRWRCRFLCGQRRHGRWLPAAIFVSNARSARSENPATATAERAVDGQPAVMCGIKARSGCRGRGALVKARTG